MRLVRRTPRALLGAVVVALALGLPGTPALAADDDGPDPGPGALDVAAAAAALVTEQVVTAPGAIAVFDPAVVLPELGPDVRILLAPPDPRIRGRYQDEVVGPLTDLVGEADLTVLLVTGLAVDIVNNPSVRSGRVSGLDGLQVLLGSYDVTDLLRLDARVVADPDAEPGSLSSPDPVPQTPVATAAQAEPVVAALRETPRWAAPGTDQGLADAQPWDELLPGAGLRVATLPAAGRGEPQPDLLPALTAAFPGEVVVVVRGRWVDVAGPDQAALTSARNYALGRFEVAFTQWGNPVDQLLRQLLDRARDLVTGDPFARDPLAPTTLDRLVSRYLPPVAAVLAVALLASSGTVAARRYARRSRVDATAVRATALAELADLDAELLAVLDAPPPGEPRGRYALATAAERRDTARTLLEAADDPGTATAVREAVAASRASLAEVPR